MITLYHAPRTRSSRFVWLLEELGAPYTIFPVSIFRPTDGSGEPDPNNPHPEKQVPCIEDKGVVIPESQAIALYLADQYPQAGLAPKIGDPARGPNLAWMAWYVAAMEPAMFAHFEGTLDQPMKKRNQEQVMARLEAALAKGPWIMGDKFTAADVLIGSALGWARAAFPQSAAIDAYTARLQARPACVRGVALDEASGVQKAE
jgi:glutathione S-transferase